MDNKEARVCSKCYQDLIRGKATLLIHGQRSLFMVIQLLQDTAHILNTFVLNAQEIVHLVFDNYL